MTAEAWIALAALILTILGGVSAAAFWAHKVYMMQSRQVAEFEHFNETFRDFVGRNERDHEHIWLTLNDHATTINRNGERLSKVEGRFAT